jgi:hypothetical protein
MWKLVVFNQVTLDGYFVDVKANLSWEHRNDEEWNSLGAGGGWDASQLPSAASMIAKR